MTAGRRGSLRGLAPTTRRGTTRTVRLFQLRHDLLPLECISPTTTRATPTSTSRRCSRLIGGWISLEGKNFYYDNPLDATSRATPGTVPVLRRQHRADGTDAADLDVFEGTDGLCDLFVSGSRSTTSPARGRVVQATDYRGWRWMRSSGHQAVHIGWCSTGWQLALHERRLRTASPRSGHGSVSRVDREATP